MARARANYHHGDLRSAALTEARNMLETVGTDGLSIRALAGRLGVAHRALYNHFADKDALFSALAATGYRELAQELTGANGPADYMRIYSRYALSNPNLYAVMMDRRYTQFETEPELRAAVDKVIAVSLANLAPADGDEDERRRAVMRYWMLVHGGLDLHLAGALKARSDEDFIDEILAVAGLGSNPKSESQPMWSAKPKPKPKEPPK